LVAVVWLSLCEGLETEMSKVAQMRELSAEQLVHELRETQQSLFKLRFQAASERNDVPSNARKLRRTIARIKTLQRERELSQA
jgi:large subunit ribosomal protein L29